MAYFGHTSYKFIPMYNGSTQAVYGNVAQCKNGKIIVVYSEYTYPRRYLVETLYDNWSDYKAGGVPASSSTIMSEVNYSYFSSIFNINDELFLMVQRNHTSYTTTSLKIYKSPSGNGGDWEEYSYINGTGAIDGLILAAEPAIPIVLESGKWMLITTYQGILDGTHHPFVGVYTSSDDGVTWELLNSFETHYISTKNSAEYNGAIYTIIQYANDGPWYMMESKDEGLTWTQLYSANNFFRYTAHQLCSSFLAANDGYLYLLAWASYQTNRKPRIYRTTSPETTPTSELPLGGWELVENDSIISGLVIDGGYPYITNLNGEIVVVAGDYLGYNGASLQTSKKYILVKEDAAGSMVFNGKTYKYVETLENFDIDVHTVAGEESTYEYGGATVTYNGLTYGYVASGITDPTAAGGYGSYLADTSRTVEALADRENFVNFYYLQVSAPTVTTGAISGQTLASGFTAGLEITSDGGGAITACGIVVGIATGPTLATGVVVNLGAKTVGVQSAKYIGALVAGQTYYVKAFATNSVGTSYGSEVTFSINATIPDIENLEVINTSEDGFTISFKVTKLDAPSVTVGILFSTTAGPTLATPGVIAKEIGSITGEQVITYAYSDATLNLGEVPVGETVYVTGYATNPAGTGYDAALTFSLDENFYWDFIATFKHSVLSGLDADDHTQYLNTTRHDTTDRHGLGTVVPHDTFVGLTDTPSSYSGQAGKVAVVNPAENAIIFETARYVHTQIVASTTWVITHNLGWYPSVTIVDSAGSLVFGDIRYDSANQITLTFSAEFGGKAYLN